METSATTVEIQKALAEAQSEIRGADKDKKGNYGFYTTLASAWNAWQESGPKHGLAVMQSISGTKEAPIITTRLGHSSGEWIQDSMPLWIGKADMQGLGSAITYGRRYSLMAMVGLAPEDDDGEQAVKDSRNEQHQQVKKAAPKPADDESMEKKDARVLLTHVKTITTEEELDVFMRDTTARIKAVHDKEPDVYETLMKHINAHTEKLKSKEAA
jgi:hypothetical protein